MKRNKILTIILNFSENGELGCEFKCSFCFWKGTDQSGLKFVPSDIHINKFIDDFGKFKKPNHPIILNGGGDPFFKYEQNKRELFRIITAIKERGLGVGIHAFNIGKAYKNFDELSQYVGEWKFSIQKMANGAREKLKRFYNVGISIVVNSTATEEYLERYCQFYLDVVDRITFGGNYFDTNINNNYFHDLVRKLNQKFDNKIKYTENNVDWDIKRKLYLVGNEVRKGYLQQTGKFTVVKKY